jgi:hypothetical protein
MTNPFDNPRWMLLVKGPMNEGKIASIAIQKLPSLLIDSVQEIAQTLGPLTQVRCWAKEREVAAWFAETDTFGSPPFPVGTLLYYQRVPDSEAFKCRLCGQVITDGKPCGCGARS